MNNSMKFGASIALAIMAAYMNMAWLSSQATPSTFVAVDVDIEEGQPLLEEMLRPVPVPGDDERLRETMIPYENRAILHGVPATTSYLAGDMVLHRDLNAPKKPKRWEVLGPFRLISVGDRFTNAKSNENTSGGSRGNNVTIAVSADFDQKTRDLLETIDPQRNMDEEDAHRIVAVQVLPTKSQGPANPATSDLKDNFVYQTVSLDGIENVPGVLLAGDLIRFVVPADR